MTFSSPALAAAPPFPGQASIQPGFDPAAQDVYLFDIDGTLLRSRDQVHYRSFSRAVHAVLGRELSLNGVATQGNIDPAILREAFRLASVEDKLWLASREQILSEMSGHVLAHRDEMSVDVMPAVPEVLQALQARGAVLGVATGNLEPIGWVKIELAGLRSFFSFGGFSDGCEDRPGMIAHALELARQHAGAHASVCVVGDTPADIAAARAHGLPTLAVATGHSSFEELMAHKPEACFTTLEHLLPLIGAARP